MAPGSTSQAAVRREKSSATTARELRREILEGDLSPGASLGEVEVGKRLGVSRTPVREALVLLGSEGLVDISPNRSASVRAFTAADLHEMHSLRAILEGYAAARAAPRATPAQLDAMGGFVDAYAALVDGGAARAIAEQNAAFHAAIIDAADSERLQALIQQVTALPLIYRSYSHYSQENRESALQDHRKILEALRDRDAERAESLMKAHILWARNVALSNLELDGEAPAGEATLSPPVGHPAGVGGSGPP